MFVGKGIIFCVCVVWVGGAVFKGLEVGQVIYVVYPKVLQATVCSMHKRCETCQVTIKKLNFEVKI